MIMVRLAKPSSLRVKGSFVDGRRRLQKPDTSRSLQQSLNLYSLGMAFILLLTSVTADAFPERLVEMFLLKMKSEQLDTKYNGKYKNK